MKEITVRVLGGLGNQMHCYAFGRALAARTGSVLKLDAESGYWDDPYGREFLLDRFPVKYAKISISQRQSRVRRNIFRLALKLKDVYSRCLPLSKKLVVREEPPFCYKDDVLQSGYTANPYFIGYWASYRYFLEIEAEIRKELRPPSPTDPAALDLLSQIRSVRSCFIHWRSYKEDKNIEYPDLYEYYSRAVRFISDRYPDTVFFVFSDDSAGARDQIDFPGINFVYVDLTIADRFQQTLTDFYLMYECENAIIGASTFSWWAAWLGYHDCKTVFAPGGVSPWGEDWLPPGWITV